MSSQILKDRSIILRTYQYSESSLVVVILARRYGKVRMMAKGARRMKSPFAGSLLTGNVCDVVFYNKEGRGIQTLTEIDVVSSWSGSHDHLERMCLLQAGLEVVDHSVVGGESDSRIFDILEKYTDKIKSAGNWWFYFYTMEVKLLILLGHFPSLEACSRCGRELREGSGIIPSSGEVLCRECGGGGTVQVSPESFKYLKNMAERDFEQICPVSLNSTVRREVGRALHYLFLHHVDGYTLPNSLRLIKGAKA